MAMTIGGGSAAPVTFITPQGELNASQVNATLMSAPSPEAGTTTAVATNVATNPAAAQTVLGTAGGGAAAAPAGAAQAVAGATTAAAPQNMDAIIAALKSIIQVINELIKVLSAQASGGGAPADPAKPADPVHQHGVPAQKPGQVGGSTGGPVQQSNPVHQHTVPAQTTQVAGATGAAAAVKYEAPSPKPVVVSPEPKPVVVDPAPKPVTQSSTTQVAGASGGGPVQQSSGSTHTIGQGQTYEGIASQYGLSIEQLRKMNPNMNLNYPDEGQVLRVR